MVGCGYLSRDFQAFVTHMAASQWVNKKSSYAECVHFGILDLTDWNQTSKNSCVCLPCRLW